MTEAAMSAQDQAVDWRRSNDDYLQLALRRLRLLLARRIIWLRRQWQEDPLQLQNLQGTLISDSRADWLLAGADDPIEERRFYEENTEARRLTDAYEAVERDLSARKAALKQEGMPPALEMLSRLFVLTEFELEVLILCLAPEIDPAFAHLYAYAADDVGLKHATPHLAMSLFRSHLAEELSPFDSFLPDAPLLRFRLLRLEGSTYQAAAWGARPMALEARVADYLRGINRVDEAAEDLLRPLPVHPLAPAHLELAEQLASLYETRTRGAPWRAVNIVAPPGAGRRALARELSNRLGFMPFQLDHESLPPSGPARLDLFRILEREAVLLPMALYLDGDEAGNAGDLIDRFAVFLIIGSRGPCSTDAPTLTVRMTKPGVEDQLALWRRALAPAGTAMDEEITRLVEQFDFGPGAIARAAEAARTSHPEGAPDPKDVWQASRELARGPLEELAQRLEPCWDWKDIVLPTEVLAQLSELAAQVAQRPKVYGEWGFGAKLTRGRGINALFSGPSGTGKTMAAEVLANHLSLDLYRIDLAGVVSKYIGETEKNLRKVFDTAEASGAVLFFDEADALFGKRTDVKDSHDRYANIEVGYLLQRMEDYRGLAILATNRKSDLDRAFLRRLRFLIDFPYPVTTTRRGIWHKVFPPQTELAGLDYDALARLEIPGGNIRNIALNAAFLAADKGTAVGMLEVMHAARREYAKIEKMATEAEFGAYYQRTAQ